MKISCTKCDKCLREIRNNNFARHTQSCSGPIIKKIRGIDFDPNWGYKDGSRTVWNKGRRDKPDTRNPEYIGKLGGYRPNAGRSKKFKVTDSFGKETTLQSSYELECSRLLDNLKIKWNRPKALKYGARNYFADFYLTEYDVYLDPKNNYKAKLDADKIAAVIKENNVKLFVLLKEQITEEYIGMLIQR